MKQNILRSCVIAGAAAVLIAGSATAEEGVVAGDRRTRRAPGPRSRLRALAARFDRRGACLGLRLPGRGNAEAVVAVLAANARALRGDSRVV